MAIHNDSRMYSAGNVVFDQQPHVQLYANLMQRKAAKDEAFDEYIRNQNKGINAAGMRNADRPVFDKKYSELQNFYIQNRDAIKNRKAGADIKYTQMNQDLLNLISESKTEEEKKKPLTEILLDPNKRERLSDTIFDDVSSHDQPIYVQKEDGTVERNPNRKSLDYGSVTFNPKPFEQDKYFKQFEDVKRMDLPPVVTDDPKTMTQTVTTNSVFDKEAKDLIATRAVTDLMQNPSFKSVVKQLDPKEYNEFYKQNYGHDIQNEADLAAAYTLKGLQQKVSTAKVNPDTYGRQVALEGIRNANANRRLALQNDYIKGRIAFRKAAGKQEQDGVLEGYIERAFDEGKDTKGVIGVKGQFVPARKIAVPVEIMDKYTISKGKGDEQRPTKFMITEDKKFVVPVYPGGSTRNRQDHIPIETFRNDLGKIWLTKKDAAAEMDELVFDEDGEEVPVSTAPAAAPKKTATQTKKADPLGLF
jgi:hypothetical protein